MTKRSTITSASGVTSIEIATAATSSDAAVASITPACAEAWKTTNPNSPPCASRIANSGRSASGTFIVRAIATSTTALTAMKPSTISATRPGCASTTAKSMLMPTAMKNSPSNRPLNGSRSVSSSRRYSLSASSTPARKAPSAIDSPTACISAAVATTSSSDAAVKISGVRLRAIQRSEGRKARRPPISSAAITATALAAVSQPLPAVAAVACCAATGNSGNKARIGMAATSWNSITPSTPCPAAVGCTLRSASTARPIAVDDIASPSEAASATGHATPNATPAAVISRALLITCTEPQPKIGRRMAHKRLGSSSRPTRNSISTTPNSATVRIVCASVTSANPQGPITMPATR